VTYKWRVLPLPSPNDDQYEQAPYHRYGHTAVAYADKAFIFGGRNDKNGACNILFCFDAGNNICSLAFCVGIWCHCQLVGGCDWYCLYTYVIVMVSVVTTIELSPLLWWLATIEPPPPSRCCTVFSAVFSALFPENCCHYPQSSYIVSKFHVI